MGLKIKLYEATKHSFGTHYINHDVSKDLLKEWFGHTTTKTTEIYAKIKVVDAFRKIQERKEKVVDISERHHGLKTAYSHGAVSGFDSHSLRHCFS